MCADGYRISYHENRPPLAVFRVSSARGLHRPAFRLHSPMHSASAPRRAKWVGPSGSKRPMQCSLCVKTKLPNMTATTNSKLQIHRLDDKRYALTLDRFLRYLGTHVECDPPAVILGHKNDLATL